MVILSSATIQYRPDIGAIIVRWSDSSIPELRSSVYDKLLELAYQCKCYRWLLDVRRCRIVNTCNPIWIQENFLPSICRKLGASVKLAYMSLPTAEVDKVENLQMQISAYQNEHVCHLGFFNHEADAYQWLEVLN